ncbi:MAG TPA: TolC family protein [Bacteroides sp.]|nr:TolC family protein [Bacteroides sp.]
MNIQNLSKNMRKILLMWILIPGIFLEIGGQEPAGGTGTEPAGEMVLTLRQAVDHALAYNKSLQHSRLEVERSRKGVWEAIAQGLPQVEGNFDYMTYFNYELAFRFGSGEDFEFTQDQIQEAMQQTLSQPQFQGITPQDLLVHQAGNFFDSQLQSMMPPSTILMSDQATATLGVSQLIFSGQYLVGIQTAKLARRITEQNLAFSELNIKESVTGSYYLVLLTRQSLRILEQNHENLLETLEQTRAMYRTGMAEKTDVDQIRITASQLDNSRRALERTLELNYNMLRFQLGAGSDVILHLTDELETLFEEIEPAAALQESLSLDDNISYQIMQSQEEINKKRLDLEKWSFAPTIAGFYNRNLKIRTTNFDMTPNHQAGLSLSLPIFSSGMRKVRLDQARIEYDMAQKSRDILKDQLQLQEKQIRYELQNSLENYHTQKENVEVAQDVYDSYRAKYQQGMASSLELTQANSNYLEAESNYLSALMEVMNAKLQLDKLMNTL